MANTYTAFCQETGGNGTTWIASLQADSVEEAKTLAQAKCAEDWQWEQEDIHVLGIAEGDVTILEWDDLND
jgi:hypothetical protein